MKGTSIIVATVLTVMLGAAGAEEYVYGRELMSDQELAEHRAKLHSLKTDEEREAYRMAHHERMEQRAQEQGIQLPDEAPAAGRPSDAGMGRDHGNMPGAMPGKPMQRGSGDER